MFEAVLVANAIWFAMAFNVFALRHRIFAKVLVPRSQRDTPVFGVLAESGKFLGGFNFALGVFNVILLLKKDVFPESEQRAILCAFFALAHASQFYFNLPIALQNRKGKGVWQVKGTMRFIFVTDFVMMTANLAVAAMYVYA